MIMPNGEGTISGTVTFEQRGAAVTVTYAALRSVLPADHDISFAFSQRSGFTQLLEAPDDEPYALVPLERLTLNAVTVDG